jgi:hypothetical protein
LGPGLGRFGCRGAGASSLPCGEDRTMSPTMTAWRDRVVRRSLADRRRAADGRDPMRRWVVAPGRRRRWKGVGSDPRFGRTTNGRMDGGGGHEPRARLDAPHCDRNHSGCMGGGFGRLLTGGRRRPRAETPPSVVAVCSAYGLDPIGPRPRCPHRGLSQGTAAGEPSLPVPLAPGPGPTAITFRSGHSRLAPRSSHTRRSSTSATPPTTGGVIPTSSCTSSSGGRPKACPRTRAGAARRPARAACPSVEHLQLRRPLLRQPRSLPVARPRGPLRRNPARRRERPICTSWRAGHGGAAGPHPTNPSPRTRAHPLRARRPSGGSHPGPRGPQRAGARFLWSVRDKSRHRSRPRQPHYAHRDGVACDRAAPWDPRVRSVHRRRRGRAVGGGILR